ncbi:MAG: hypothetical protein IJS94_07465 [Clostridia bacterium]|nr:hypothetical protein [Clostridia bacterium]
MLKAENAYRYSLNVSFILHVILAVYIVIACFLPFIDGENYFVTYKGIFAERFTRVQPVVILAMPFLSAAFSFLVLRRDFYDLRSFLQAGVFQLGTLIGDFCFAFIIMIKPITMLETGLTSINVFTPFDRTEIDGHVFGTGFYMVSYASYIIYFDIAMLLFSLIICIVKKIRER